MLKARNIFALSCAGLLALATLVAPAHTGAESLKNMAPEGYSLKSTTVGDTEVEYFDVSDITKLSDEELSQIEPAAGVSTQKFVGPRRIPQTNDVWATENLE